MNLVSVFVNVLLPIFILMGFGVLLDRKLHIDVKSVSRVTFFIFSPCLIFSSLVSSMVSGQDSTLILAFVLLVTLVLGVIASLLGRLTRVDRVTMSAFMLSTLFMNSGNYGLSVNLFAFGEEGLARAALFFVGSAILSNTVGVFLAARGRAGARTALTRVFKAPLVYAAVAALLVNLGGWQVPEPISKALSIAGNGAVPSLLIVLGMQLSRTSIDSDVLMVVLATILRLIVAAGAAWLLADLMSLQGVTRQVCIVQASMPAAVTPLIIAVEYDAKPKFVTSVIFVSTLASMVTLAVLLSILI